MMNKMISEVYTNLLSEYTDDRNRCARVYEFKTGGYQVNFWDAITEEDFWKPYFDLEKAENDAEDWVLIK
jgi:hypothetical protein